MIRWQQLFYMSNYWHLFCLFSSFSYSKNNYSFWISSIWLEQSVDGVLGRLQKLLQFLLTVEKGLESVRITSFFSFTVVLVPQLRRLPLGTNTVNCGQIFDGRIEALKRRMCTWANSGGDVIKKIHGGVAILIIKHSHCMLEVMWLVSPNQIALFQHSIAMLH